MGNSLYSAGNSHAKSLAKGGKVTKPDSWNKPSADSENSYIEKNGIEAFAKWHLGIDESVDKQTKGAYKYIFTSDFKNVDRAGIIAIKQRSGGQGDEAILNAAGKILDMIDGKSFFEDDIDKGVFEVKAEKVEELRAEKSIVHWISTKDIDRGGDVVNPRGMNDGDFAKSPAVWYNHNYVWNPNAIPIAKSLWRKKKDEGVLAKTQFADHPFAEDIYNLHAGGFMSTWSIGFKIDRTKQNATTFDSEKNIFYINAWELLEYSSAPIAMNPNAMDEMKHLLKSDGAKYILKNMEDESSIKLALESFKSELSEIKQNYDTLKSLVESKDDSHIEQMQNEILELKNLIKQQEETLKNQVVQPSENLVNMTEEQFAQKFKSAIEGEFRRLRGRD